MSEQNNIETRDPLPVILEILNRIMQMGGNDSEKSSIDNIVAEYQAGNITGPEAEAQAQAILDAKQDYH